jgi:NRPS condensation-like uncharacterized protein
MALRIPFNIIDETFVHADDPAQPLTVQMEARVGGSLDEDRMRQALAVVVAAHPLARARLRPWTADALAYEWEVDDEVQVDPLRTVTVEGEGDLDAVRAELQSGPVSLFESPPLRARLVHAPGGDAVMLAVHHAASDGMGALRLLRSVVRAYAGLPEDGPALDPVASHSLSVAGTPSLSERVRGGMVELRKLGNVRSLPARVAADGGSPGAGYGITTLRVPVSPLLDSPLRRRLGATMNDLLLAALHRSIGRWNQEHGEAAERISVHMPINARPPEWREEVVGNLVVGEAVSTTPAERESPERCLATVAGWTEAVKQRGPRPALEALAALPRGPVAARRAMVAWATTAGQRFADTAVLSNVGRVPAALLAGGEVTEVWFSPPVGMPTGVGVGVAATDEVLCLALRHRRPLLSDDAARRLGGLLVEELEVLAGP